MTKETYIKVTGIIRDNPKRVRQTHYINKLLTGFVFVLYPIFLLILFSEQNPFLVRAILVPAISFVAVSVFRKVVNIPRPYEKFDIPPVLEKDTKGKSFPSRHVFSVFVIAMTIFHMHTDAGILLCVIGAALAFIRVIGGVHEPRDVIAGALIGIASGVIGYYLI